MDELDRILANPRESRGVELKSSMDWADAKTQAKVIRTALAMANRQGGGLIVFGCVPDGSRHVAEGMQVEHADSFDQDDVQAKVNRHAAPHVDLEVLRREHDEQRFIAIRIQQFTSIPVICARDLVLNQSVVVHRGRVLCRSRRVPESTEVQEVEDMREILDLAAEEALKRYFQLRTIETSASSPAESEAAFRAELGGL